MSLVTIRSLSKRFGATQALNDVSLTLEAGEVHGLLGENGAGKSTLMKVLSGAVVPDTGSVTIGDHELKLGFPQASRQAGMAMAYQELSAPPNVTVAEKLLLPDLPRSPWGTVSRRRLHRRARELLTEWQKPDIRPGARIDSLDLADKQHVEIIAALARKPRLLLLDEPTASLPDPEWLFAQIKRVSGEGTCVIYISHKLAEITRICDRGTVLRNGTVVETFTAGETDERRLVELMIGRSLNHAFPQRSADAGGPGAVLVDMNNVTVAGAITDISLKLRAREIVGVAALEGQGQKALFYTIAGLTKPDSGTVNITATESGVPVALVPEDRKTEGLFLTQSVQFNLGVSRLRELAVAGTISSSKEKQIIRRRADELNIARAQLPKAVQSLSGGNQQKAVVGRALSQEPSCLLLFDPTRGVDAATKVEIYGLARRFADSGHAVLMYSTEIPELIGVSDRVYTVYGGRITGEYQHDQLDEHSLMSSVIGHEVQV